MTARKKKTATTAKVARSSKRGSKPGERRGGRAKGTPNKVTADARAAIAKFVDGNAHRLQDWLDQIAEGDPERAFTLFQSVIEYHVPKLARSELTGAGGTPLAPPTVHVHFEKTQAR